MLLKTTRRKIIDDSDGYDTSDHSDHSGDFNDFRNPIKIRKSLYISIFGVPTSVSALPHGTSGFFL